MKLKSKYILLSALLLSGFLAFSFYEKAILPLPVAGPASIAGIVIDGTGKQISTSGIQVHVTDSKGNTYPGKVSQDGNNNDVYSIPTGSTVPPDNLVATLGPSTFYSWADSLDPSLDSIWAVLNSSNASASIDLVFLNHNRSAVATSMTAEVSQTGVGIVSSGKPTQTNPPDNTLHYRYVGVQPLTTYTVRCLNPTTGAVLADVNGRKITRTFTTGSVGAYSTVGYTFFMQ